MIVERVEATAWGVADNKRCPTPVPPDEPLEVRGRL
jgi:hypothetical protein